DPAGGAGGHLADRAGHRHPGTEARRQGLDAADERAGRGAARGDGAAARRAPVTRIVAGRAGGHRLQVPAKGTRPTSERVREALFSHLDHLGYTDGTRVLDLYAGSGALGLEAVSRGARSAVLVAAARGAIAARRAHAARTPLVAPALPRP